MGRKAKPVITVGTPDWRASIPRPPKGATHARLTCLNDTYDNGAPKTATLLIQDFGCFKGVTGEFHYLKMDKKGKSLKVSKEYPETWYWNGTEVEGLPL